MEEVQRPRWVHDLSIGYEYLSGQTGNARYPLSGALYNAVFGSGGSSVPSGTPPTISKSSLPSGTVSTPYSDAHSLGHNADHLEPGQWFTARWAVAELLRCNYRY